MEIARGGSPRPIKAFLTEESNGVNWIKIGDTEKGGKYINQAREKIKPEGVSKSRLVHKGDFLLTNSMSFGRPYILNVDGCIHDGWLVLSDNFKAFDKDFLYYLLSSKFAYYQFCESVSGAVVKNLNSDKVAISRFAIPPINEQKRIANKIESLVPLIEKYEKFENELYELNSNIKGQLKKSILQYAIEGKLVPQDLNDEPATVLLERMHKEKEKLIADKKIKKDKNESMIYRRDNSYYEKCGSKILCIDEEIPFEIPNDWGWIRLGKLTYNHGQKKPNCDFCYIDIGSVNNEEQVLNKSETVLSADKAPSRARKIVKFGDILYSTVRPYLHNMCIINRSFTFEPIASTGFAVLTCHSNYLNEFLFMYMMSPIFDEYANRNENSRGVAYPAINDSRLSVALIPVPPVSEQQRIIDNYKRIINILS